MSIRQETAASVVRGLPSTMGDGYQLNMSTLIRHAARTHGSQEIVHRTSTGHWERYTYRDCYERVSRAAGALRRLGVAPGDRVGVLAWNDRRHFELYWAIPGLGAVMLQLNLRLESGDLAYVLEHSRAKYVLVDESLLPIAEAVAPLASGVLAWVVMTDRPSLGASVALRPRLDYESLIATESPSFAWPEIDEKSACAACYTTGTTGRPKGVYYSHRAIYLHSAAMATNLGMTIDDCTMMIAPMFHAQSWGLPQAATLMANKIVLPGRYSADDIGPLTHALIDEGVTVTNGAPAIFRPMLRYIEGMLVRPNLSRLRMLCGATEPPVSMMKGYHNLTGAEIVHAYGATETTPLVAVNRIRPSLKERLGDDAYWKLKTKQGLLVIGVDVKIVSAEGEELPHDGRTVGEVCMKGPWITCAYYDMPEASDRFIDGWWRSGDVGSIDADGYLKISDRLKDVIKSGGEWISSIDMENALMGHPAVLEAAVIGISHATWQERPLALVIIKAGQTVLDAELRSHLLSSFAKWQLPDEILQVDSIPKTSVGKIDKKRLRSTYATQYGETP